MILSFNPPCSSTIYTLIQTLRMTSLNPYLSCLVHVMKKDKCCTVLLKLKLEEALYSDLFLGDYMENVVFQPWADSETIWKTFFSSLSGCWNYLDNVVSQSERILMLSGERFPALSWFLNYLENIVSQPWVDSETIWKTFFTSLSRFWNYLENVISQLWADF